MTLYAYALSLIGGQNSNSFAYIFLVGFCVISIIEIMYRGLLCYSMFLITPSREIIIKFVE